MSAYSGQNPTNAKDIGVTFASSGLLVKFDANGILATASVGDKPIGVTIDESSRGADNALEAAGTGTVSILPLTGVQYIKFIASGALKTGSPIYTAQTAEADGHCKASAANSAVFIGYYFGEDGITPATGDLIPVFCRGAHI
tara:strand:+ start:15438 stop:15863 length:426 start_codon:yes stop_codon:yes gene_type:complete